MSPNSPSTLLIQANQRFSVREIYRITHDAARSTRDSARLSKHRGKQFSERIMLAVTEVNGCALCAHAHTKYALETGMKAGEIRDLLGGVTDGAPDRELPAIAFAQHYADSRARPEASAWDRLVEVYGEPEARGILGATRLIMWGNAVGIPLSSLRARRRGNPHPRSSVGYEIGTPLGAIVTAPLALLHAALSTLRRVPLLR